MERIDLKKARDYFFNEFEDKYIDAIEAHKKLERLNEEIEIQEKKAKQLEKEKKAYRPEVEDIVNLETLFTMGGQQMPIDTSVKDKLSQKSAELNKLRKEIANNNRELRRLQNKAHPITDKDYKVYKSLAKISLTLQRIRNTPAYMNYWDIEENLQYVYALAHYEEKGIDGIDEKYMHGLVKKEIPGCDFTFFNDVLLGRQMDRTLNTNFTDDSIREIYDKVSASAKAVMTYEEYCLSHVQSVVKNAKGTKWVVNILNAFFIRMGKEPFSESQERIVNSTFDYIFHMEKIFPDISSDLWNGIELPKEAVDENANLKCIDVASSYRVWACNLKKAVNSPVNKPVTSTVNKPVNKPVNNPVVSTGNNTATNTNVKNDKYNLTSAHMVLVMTEAAYVSCWLHKGQMLSAVLLSAALVCFWGFVTLFILHISDKRMKKAKTIISSARGFIINTFIIIFLISVELIYLRKLGVSTLHCTIGAVVAMVVYGLYLLIIASVKRRDGGDR